MPVDEKVNSPNLPPSPPRQEEESLPREWLERLISAMNMFRLYAPDHPEAARELALLSTATDALQALHNGEIALSQSDRAVAVNHVPMNPRVLAFRRMGEELRRRNLHTLIFSQGVDAQELSEFLCVFSDRPQNIVAKGGLALLMEERGIRHVRLAGLQYAARAEESETAETPDDERVLFARMENCLMDQASEDARTTELVTYLENPKTTARFLQRHAGDAEPDPEFAREVVDTLEKAGTLVYTRQPEQWNAIKRQIAEAMLLLPPRLRERVLEIVTARGRDTVLLEEMVGEFQPEEIAVVLADYLSHQDAPGAAAGAPADPSANHLIRQLIQSPDHFQVLQPMLADEFKSRGMRLEDHAALFGPFHGEYFARAQGQRLAPISSDKLMIFHTTRGPADGEPLQGDWLETLEESVWEDNLEIVQQEILSIERHPAYYRQLLGPRILETALRHCAAGRRDAARWDLALLLEQAAGDESEGFDGRRDAARELLGRLDPATLVDLFGGLADADEAFDASVQHLATCGLARVHRLWLQRGLDPALAEATAARSLALLAGHAQTFAPAVLDWLSSGGDGDSPRLWTWLEAAHGEAVLPVVRMLASAPSAPLAARAVEFLGRYPGDAAEAMLAERARADDEPARLAESELSRLGSPRAVPLLARHLTGVDFWGRKHARRLEVIRVLARIDTLEARRALLDFMLQSGRIWQRTRLRGLILEALLTVRRWPPDEARDALDRIARHPDRKVAREARNLRLRLEDRGEIA